MAHSLDIYRRKYLVEHFGRNGDGMAYAIVSANEVGISMTLGSVTLFRFNATPENA